MKKLENSDSHVLVMAPEHLEALKSKRYSQKTVDIHDRAIRDFAGFVGNGDVRTISRQHLERYRRALLDREFKASSIITYMQVIRSFFRHLEQNQIIFENPAEHLPPMKVPALLQPVPSEEEMHILLSQPDTATETGIRDRALLETLYSTGLRRQEALDLKVSSLNLKEGRARAMGKGQRERVVPLGKDAVEWLERYLAEVRPMWAQDGSGEALWLGHNSGLPLGYDAMQQILLRYRKAPGITTRIGLHSIRRACATHMLARGASPVAIQALLGHSALQHLSQYLKVTIADLKQAHEKSRVGA